MKTAGVIAEYNPFHNGHKYQLDKIRQETGADYIIAAMSGDFLQRGVPALTDKYRRTRMALAEGADLVIELPCVYAAASAELFARGGVNLLAAAGVVDVLCYGCEINQPDLMKKLVSLLTEESPEYQKLLRAHLSAGVPYPTARVKALSFLLAEKSPTPEINNKEHAMEAFLATPNNILALEYEKALALLPDSISHKPVSHPILRVGGGYHSRELFPGTNHHSCPDSHPAPDHETTAVFSPSTGAREAGFNANADTGTASFASATAIRNALDSCNSENDIRETLSQAVPDSVLNMLCDAFFHQALLTVDDFSLTLYTRLWSCRESGYESFADCSRELSHKIQNHLDEFVSFTQFAKLLKSREVTYTRVCRVLTHIMLGITREDPTARHTTMGITQEDPTARHTTTGITRENLAVPAPVPYLRVLGFRKSAAPLLSAIKKEASAPLVTKVSDASRILSPSAYSMLQKDIHCADLYRSTISMRSRTKLPNEFTQGLIIVP